MGSKRNDAKRQPRTPSDHEPQSVLPIPERSAIELAYSFGVQDPNLYRPERSLRLNDMPFVLRGELDQRDWRRVCEAFDARWHEPKQQTVTDKRSRRVRCEVPGCRTTYPPDRWLGKIGVRIIAVDGVTMRGWVCNDCYREYLNETEE